MEPDPIVETHLVGTPGAVLHEAGAPLPHLPSAAAPPRPPRSTARHAAPEPPRALLSRTWTLGVPLLLILLGTAIRVRQWAAGRSLWLDEALVAESVITRDYAGLVSEPLLHSQAAPVLWLWLERLCVDAFGTDERALRVVPLLAGVGTLLVTWLLARRLLPSVLSPVPVAIVALTPSLVYYSTEVKPYATDVLVVLVLVLLSLSATGRAGLLRLALVSAALLWLSYATVLAMAGISVVLVLRSARKRQWRAAVLTAGLLTPWLASLAVAYALVLADLRGNDVLKEYWDHTFPREQGLPLWFGELWADLVTNPLELDRTALALALLTIGAVRLVWLARTRAALALAIVPMATVAAALAAYPFAARLSLWLVPLAALALAAVLPTRMDRPGSAWLLGSTVALTLVVGPSLQSSLPSLVRVKYVEEIRPVLEQVAAERRPGDTVLINIGARGAFDFYERLLPIRRDGNVLFITTPDTGCDDRIALRTGRFATERVWVVFSHELVDAERLGSTEDMIARIQTVTSIARTIQAPGSKAYLFDPVAGAQAVQPDVVRNPLRCLGVYRSSR